MPLISTQNPVLQRLRKAIETGRPLEDGTLTAEGPHLLQEALGSPWDVEHVFCSTEGLARHAALLNLTTRRRIEVTEVSVRAFESISSTEQTQGVLSVIRPKIFTWPDLNSTSGPLVVLDGIQDPGNAGAIARSAEAFGAGSIVFSEGCVRISNGKLLRAAAGSIFRLPFLENQARDFIAEQLRVSKRAIFALAANGQDLLPKAVFRDPFALIVGNEGAGISPLLGGIGRGLAIPTKSVESLNAAIACSIVLYEAARQRQA